tara:strand:+ start:91 stop:561 length:471 start_codon:yes stop_codon:yes gene_type:complete
MERKKVYSQKSFRDVDREEIIARLVEDDRYDFIEWRGSAGYKTAKPKKFSHLVLYARPDHVLWDDRLISLYEVRLSLVQNNCDSSQFSRTGLIDDITQILGEPPTHAILQRTRGTTGSRVMSYFDHLIERRSRDPSIERTRLVVYPSTHEYVKQEE